MLAVATASSSRSSANSGGAALQHRTQLADQPPRQVSLDPRHVDAAPRCLFRLVVAIAHGTLDRSVLPSLMGFRLGADLGEDGGALGVARQVGLQHEAQE